MTGGDLRELLTPRVVVSFAYGEDRKLFDENAHNFIFNDCRNTCVRG